MPDHDETRDQPPSDPTATHLPAAGTVPPNVTLDHVPGAAAVPPDITISGYELLGELGRGGMGVVYRARQTTLNREVAIKTLLRTDATRAALARFWAEAEVMAAVKHPHVVQVIELGDHDGRPFMVMELLTGGSLEDRLAAGERMSPRLAAELLAKVAGAVAAAHELGIVHRDLKPGNVLLSPAGEPKVTDFGIAKRQSHALTQTNVLMGTPAYMAPEQAAARAKFVGPQADVWALGVILYECIAGKRPFDGDTAQAMLNQITSTEPVALRARVPGLSRDLDTIVTKCLSKEPQHRYATAAELASDLERFARGEPIAARPVGMAERLVRWVRRKPTAAAAWGVSALAVMLALVVFVILGFWRDAEVTRADAVEAKQHAEVARNESLRLQRIADAGHVEEARLRGDADEARDEAIVFRGIAEKAQKEVERKRAKLATSEYGWTVQIAHQECRDNNIVRARTLLESTDPALRGWEWQYVHRLCQGSYLALKGHTENVVTASFSPDGSTIVTASTDNSAKVWNSKTGDEMFTLKDNSHGARFAVFSADGSRIVTVGSSGANRPLIVWDAKAGTMVRAFKGYNDIHSASLTVVGSRIYAFTSDSAMVWNAKSGAEILTLPGGGKRGSMWVSPDGTRIVTIGAHAHTAKVWDAKTGAELFTLKGHAAKVTSASFSTDGLQVVTASWDNTAKVWNAKTGAEVFTLKGHTNGVMSAEFSPDGLRIVTTDVRINPLVRGDLVAKVWDVKTGKEVATLTSGGLRFIYASFSPDGSQIVTTSDKGHKAQVWDAKTGLRLFTLTGYSDNIWSVSFSPDGSRIVSTGDEKVARVWDARTPSAVPTLTAQNGSVPLTSLFSPEGTRVITILSNGRDATARVWDAKSGTDLLTLKGFTRDIRYPVFVHSTVFSADGSQLVVPSLPNTATVWNVKTGREIHTLRGHAGTVNSALFSPDGSRIVTTSSDKTAKVWNAKTGAEINTLVGHKQSVRSALFSPDGSRILTTSDNGTVKVWDAKTGNELLTLKKHVSGLMSPSFSADGSCVLTRTKLIGSQEAVTLWDSKTGDELLTIKDHTDSVECASFSPDRSRIVTCNLYDNNLARVWDVKTGAELFTLKGHIGVVMSACFSPDGSRIVTGSSDTTAKLWDTKTGAEVLTLKGHTASVHPASFSADGSRIITSSLDGKVKIWDATPLVREFIPRAVAPMPRAVVR